MPASSLSLTIGITVRNRSGTIAAGTTSQVAAAANNDRRFLYIQNASTASEPLYIEFGAVATINTTSIELAVGASVLFDSCVPVGSVNVNATTTGHRYFILES